VRVSWPVPSTLPQGRVSPDPGRRPPQRRGDRPEQGDRRYPVGDGQVSHASVVANHKRCRGDQRGQARQRGLAGQHRLLAQPRRLRYPPGHRPFRLGPGDHYPFAGRRQGASHCGEPLGRPSPARAGRAGVQHDRLADPGRKPRAAEPQRAAVRGHAIPFQQPAPAVDLVLPIGPPGAGHIGAGRRGVHHRRFRAQGPDQVVAGWAATVQVDGDGGRWPGPPDGTQLPGRQHPVHRSGQRSGRRQRPGRGQHDLMLRIRSAQGTVGGHGGEEVPQYQGAEDEQPPLAAHRTTLASSRSHSARNRRSP
jgi:hypothetical protein